MFKHKHASGVHQRNELDYGTPRSILLIETSLSLKPDDPDYDDLALKELNKAAAEYLDKHPHLTDYRVRSALKDRHFGFAPRDD